MISSTNELGYHENVRQSSSVRRNECGGMLKEINLLRYFFSAGVQEHRTPLGSSYHVHCPKHCQAVCQASMARRRSTASARSEAEPRTRATDRPLASAAMRSRPSRSPPPPERRPLSSVGPHLCVMSELDRTVGPSLKLCLYETRVHL